MNPQLKLGLDKALHTWKRLGLVAKAAVLASIAVVAGLFALSSGDHSTYTYLFTSMDAADAGEVVAKLKEQRIPYRIEGDGGAILVPEAQVHELRLQLAQEGLPKGGGVGFELFDKSQFGQSEFVQQKNYVRALQGELERTIGSLAEVQKARVHLAIPERHLFRQADESASASVVVKLRGGRSLSEAQAQGILHLVSASVPHLSADHVTLVDDSGAPLAATDANQPASGAFDYKHKVEHDYEQKIRVLLERVVGAGKASVQVSAETDFTQNERTEETYDQERSALRSEQVSEDKSAQPQTVVGGIPGARSNLPGGTAPQAATQPTESATNSHHGETRNYEVGKIVSHTVAAPARLVRLNVAAAVDGVYSDKKFAQRTPEEMETLLALVRQAAGLDAKRGDQIELRCVQFASEAEDAPAPSVITKIEALRPYIPFAALGLGALLVSIFALAAIRMRVMPNEILPALPYPRSLKDMQPLLDAHAATQLSATSSAGALAANTQTSLHEAVGRDQERTLSVVRGWLSQPKSDGAQQ